MLSRRLERVDGRRRRRRNRKRDMDAGEQAGQVNLPAAQNTCGQFKLLLFGAVGHARDHLGAAIGEALREWGNGFGQRCGAATGRCDE